MYITRNLSGRRVRLFKSHLVNDYLGIYLIRPVFRNLQDPKDCNIPRE